MFNYGRAYLERPDAVSLYFPELPLVAGRIRPGTGSATLDELAEAADRIETGQPLSPEMDIALMHGTCIGGARPSNGARRARRR